MRFRDRKSCVFLQKMHDLCQNFVTKVVSFKGFLIPPGAISCFCRILSQEAFTIIKVHFVSERRPWWAIEQNCCFSWLGQKEKVKVWKSSDLELLTSLICGCRKMTKVSAISAAVRRTQAALHHGHLHHHQGHEEQQQPGVEQEGQGGPHLSGHHQSWCRSGAGQVATSSTWDCAGGTECTRVVWTPPAPSCTRVLEREPTKPDRTTHGLFLYATDQLVPDEPCQFFQTLFSLSKKNYFCALLQYDSYISLCD